MSNGYSSDSFPPRAKDLLTKLDIQGSTSLPWRSIRSMVAALFGTEDLRDRLDMVISETIDLKTVSDILLRFISIP